MQLSPADQVVVKRLLLQREAAFDDLCRIEQAITELAGCAYPFGPPDAIPRSFLPRKNQKKTARSTRGPA